MITVNPDKNMRAARLIELGRRATMLRTTINDQESVKVEGDPAIVALRAKKVAAHRAELADIDAEIAAIEAAG